MCWRFQIAEGEDLLDRLSAYTLTFGKYGSVDEDYDEYIYAFQGRIASLVMRRVVDQEGRVLEIVMRMQSRLVLRRRRGERIGCVRAGVRVTNETAFEMGTKTCTYSKDYFLACLKSLRTQRVLLMRTFQFPQLGTLYALR